MGRRLGACLIAALALSGCAIRQPSSGASAAGAAGAPRTLDGPKRVIAVRLPAVTVPPSFAGDPLVQKLALEEAQQLIERLRASGLFAEVELESALVRQPDLVVTPIDDGAYDQWSERDFWFTYSFVTGITIGLVPYVEPSNKDVHCARLDRDVAELRCEWRVLGVFGWAALPLLPSASWQHLPDEAAFVAHLQACIAERADFFVAAAPSPPP